MSDIWHRFSLPLKIALAATLLCLLCSLAVVVLLQRNQQAVVSHRLDALGEALVSRLANAAASPLAANDPLALQAVVSGYAGERAVLRAAVYDPARHLVAAAGGEGDGGQEYLQAIRWQDAAVGQAVLTLDPDAAGSELLHATDLLAVAGVAALLAGALALWAGRRVDRALRLLGRRLSGEQVDLSWRGRDSLGNLLRTPAPPLLAAESIVHAHAEADWALLQLYCPAETGDASEYCWSQAETVAQLYGGEASVNRAGGVLLRFPLGATAEERFQIVCAAVLLGEVTRDQQARLALTVLRREEVADRWLEQAAIERAYGVALAIGDGRLVLDAEFAADTTLRDRVELTVEQNGWAQITALVTPYDTLLRRQCAALRLAA